MLTKTCYLLQHNLLLFCVSSIPAVAQADLAIETSHAEMVLLPRSRQLHGWLQGRAPLLLPSSSTWLQCHQQVLIGAVWVHGPAINETSEKINIEHPWHGQPAPVT